MTSKTSAVSRDPSCKPAIRLSLSNLAALLAVFTDPGMRRGALTLRDGTVIEVVSDEERYGDARPPTLEPDARACKDAIRRLARTRRERRDQETNRELDRAFESVQVASSPSCAVQK
jgi:predicted  nucleic acid-binding Zn-ribbon protein